MTITVGGTTITFNDGTTQSTAAGAAASTDFGGIGSYAILMNAANSNLAVGGTIAGSSLRYAYTANANVMYPVFTNGFALARFRDSTATYNGGGNSLSGTWRKVDSNTVYYTYFNTCSGVQFYYWGLALYVRIA